MGDHPQADRRGESHADRERLLQHRMPRVKRRHEEYAQQRRDAEVVPERRGQLHLLIVNEIRHDEVPAGNWRVMKPISYFIETTAPSARPRQLTVNNLVSEIDCPFLSALTTIVRR